MPATIKSRASSPRRDTILIQIVARLSARLTRHTLVTAVVTVVKFAAIVIAHQRLARLLDVEAARLSDLALPNGSVLGQAQATS